jgi:hypothetical protein
MQVVDIGQVVVGHGGLGSGPLAGRTEFLRDNRRVQEKSEWIQVLAETVEQSNRIVSQLVGSDEMDSEWSSSGLDSGWWWWWWWSC